MESLLINLASMLIGYFCNFFKNRINDYLNRQKYKGIDINGEWISKGIKQVSDTEIEHDTRIKLKQIGQKIQGEIDIFSTYDGVKEVEQFKGFIEGRIHLSIIILNYYPINPQYVGAGSLFLEPFLNSSILEGTVTFINRKNNKVETVENVTLNKLNNN